MAHLLAEWARDSTPFRSLQDAVMQGRALDSQIENYWNLVEEARQDEIKRVKVEHQQAWEKQISRPDSGDGEEVDRLPRRRRSSVGAMDQWYQGYLRGESPVGKAAHITQLPWKGQGAQPGQYNEASGIDPRSTTPEPEASDASPYGQTGYQYDGLFVDKNSEGDYGSKDSDGEDSIQYSTKGDDDMDWESTDDETGSQRQGNVVRLKSKKKGRGLKLRSKPRRTKQDNHSPTTTDDDPDGQVFESQRSGGGGEGYRWRLGLGGLTQDGELPPVEDGDEVMESIESDDADGGQQIEGIGLGLKKRVS